MSGAPTTPRRIAAIPGQCVRAVNQGRRRLRHAWLDLRVGDRVRRLQRGLARKAARVSRQGAGAVQAARQLAWYTVPDERRTCPGCGAAAIRHLQPLSYTRPIATGRRYGFVSGCEQCGLVFANPLPDPSLLASTYTPDGKWGQTRPDHEPPVSRRRLIELYQPIAREFDVLRPPPGAAVLDVGCGLGGMLDSLAACGWTTFGIDPGTRAAFDRHRELTGIPDTPQFDLVILHHVLEHVIDPSSLLSQLARATRPGRYILISVPNLDTLPQHRDFPYCIRSTTHVLAYTRRCLTWLLAAAGFRAIEDDAAPPSTVPKRQVIVGRREEGALPRPRHPLTDARAALDGYASGTENAPRPSSLPVRVHAALANLRRTGMLRSS